MGRHSVPFEDDTDTVIDVLEVPEDQVMGRHEMARMYYGPDPHATDVLPKQQFTEADAEELKATITVEVPDQDEDARHRQLVRQRERFVIVLWALFVLGVILGGLALAMYVTDYTNGGCPDVRPGVFPHG
jgi:hypothetical protein